MNFKTYYVPEYLKKHFDFSTAEKNGNLSLENASFREEFFGEGFDAFLKRSSEIFEKMGIDEIISHLDAASVKFLDKSYAKRISAIGAISDLSGFSPESVERSIDLEFLSSRAPEMRLALENEFSDHRALDGFVYNRKLGGYTKIVPRAPVFAVSSSNIPALPHLSIMRSFLTKNPVVLKTSREEPVFTPLYMEALAETGSPLAECAVAVCYESEKKEITEKLIERSNTVIVYGGIRSEAYFKKAVSWPKTLILHSHKMGFGVIGRSFMKDMNGAEIKDLAAKIAFDTITFEQRACLAPHAYFYSVDENMPVAEFAAKMIEALETAEAEIPAARLSAGESYARRSYMDSLLFSDRNAEIFETKSKKSAVITMNSKEFPVSPLNRLIHLVPFGGTEEIFNIISHLEGYFQNVSLNVSGDELEMWAGRLAKLGVSRICRAGEMPTPSMMWHHDGINALSAMVRYCDMEGFSKNVIKS